MLECIDMQPRELVNQIFVALIHSIFVLALLTDDLCLF